MKKEGGSMEGRNACPYEDCGGEMMLSSQAGWSAGKKMICSNPFCPGKKLPEAIRDGLAIKVGER